MYKNTEVCRLASSRSSHFNLSTYSGTISDHTADVMWIKTRRWDGVSDLWALAIFSQTIPISRDQRWSTAFEVTRDVPPKPSLLWIRCWNPTLPNFHSHCKMKTMRRMESTYLLDHYRRTSYSLLESHRLRSHGSWHQRRRRARTVKPDSPTPPASNPGLRKMARLHWSDNRTWKNRKVMLYWQCWRK